jgi:hypothetical protein
MASVVMTIGRARLAGIEQRLAAAPGRAPDHHDGVRRAGSGAVVIPMSRSRPILAGIDIDLPVSRAP